MGPNDGHPGPERRATPRVQLLSHVFFSAGRVEGRGVLHELSKTGARVEDTSPRLKPGTTVQLTFALDQEGQPLDISATVVRETESGFGVQFAEINERLELWIQETLSRSDQADSPQTDPSSPPRESGRAAKARGTPSQRPSGETSKKALQGDQLEAFHKFLARAYDERAVERMKVLKPGWNIHEDMKALLARLGRNGGWSENVRREAQRIAEAFLEERFGRES
jgi:hypothetical protein